MDNTQQIKDLLGILNDLATLAAVVVGALAAYGILLLSSRPRVLVEIMLHWPPATTINNIPFLSVQFRFLNPAMGSQVVTEINIDQLILRQGSRTCSMSPYAILEPLALSKKREFEYKEKEFVHPLVMIGHGQEVLHVAFFPDSGNRFDPIEGSLSIQLSVKYVTHHPLRRLFRKPKAQPLDFMFTYDLDADEASRLTKEKIGWLGRDLAVQDA